MDELLHVYGQSYWHTPALVIGQKTALLKLRDAIDKALQDGHGRCDVFANDGEGYTVHVLLEDSDWLNNPWTEMELPYTDPVANQGDKSPWSLLKVVAKHG